MKPAIMLANIVWSCTIHVIGRVWLLISWNKLTFFCRMHESGNTLLDVILMTYIGWQWLTILYQHRYNNIIIMIRVNWIVHVLTILYWLIRAFYCCNNIISIQTACVQCSVDSICVLTVEPNSEYNADVLRLVRCDIGILIFENDRF